MWYVSSMPNSSGAYSGPKSNSFSCALTLTDNQVRTLIQYNGFVTITQEPDPEIEGSTVTVTPNTEAWEAWKESQSPEPDPEPDQTEQLNAAILFSRMMVQTASLTPDQTIQVSTLYPEWTLGRYKVGDIRLATYQGTHQPWKCRQEHDTATYPDITPDGSAWRTFWIPFHGTTPETAQDWIAPSGAHDQYEAGEYMVWTDGNTYRCKQATVYTPEEYARAWEVYNA